MNSLKYSTSVLISYEQLISEMARNHFSIAKSFSDRKEGFHWLDREIDAHLSQIEALLRARKTLEDE